MSKKQSRRLVVLGSIGLYFVICLEILIMISPFAGFFYAVFNPFLLFLANSPATHWLAGFFLPHMVIPSTPFLVAVRYAGSILFITGLLFFLVCAIMIYSAKFTSKGAVIGGPYARIRHPQYLALAICGAGLAILWPRILTPVLWCLMVLVYFWLAKDEERRMLSNDPDTYHAYMNKTGMFLPKSIERYMIPAGSTGRVITFFLLTGLVMGSVFCLRAYTINHLTQWGNGTNIAAVAILPEDGFKMEHRMPDILAAPEVKQRLDPQNRYLIYVMPTDYIMQGLIGDTGTNWQLYKHHHSLAMITDWILHPFRHLRQGHHAMPGMDHAKHQQSMQHETVKDDVVRRLIVLRLENIPAPSGIKDYFAIGVQRLPDFMLDYAFHQNRLLEIKDLPRRKTGWGKVPTPTF